MSRDVMAAELEESDVPYGEDWDDAEEASRWAESADRKRPWRAEIRESIAERIADSRPAARVLELGSGPGLLAERVLSRCPGLSGYTLLDFSEPMLELSRHRLASFPRARFVRASFKSAEWVSEVDAPFDVVLSMQAVHELRHKRHAVALYEQVRRVLAPGGMLLVCDHLPFDDSPKSANLYMTEEEQVRALTDAGFSDAGAVMSWSGLVLYHSTRCKPSS